MLEPNNEENLYKIFLTADDFCTGYDHYIESRGLSPQLKNSRRGPKCKMCDSEIMTILIFYHYSGFKCFEYYYRDLVLPKMGDYFHGLVSYERFVYLIPRVALQMNFLLQMIARNAQETGFYYADSKKLPVCDNLRIHSNRVFSGIAKRGKSSTGWFYGLKLHLVINNLGEIASAIFSPANVSDNQPDLLRKLLKHAKGLVFADKGYISKIFKELYEDGTKLVTRIRSNMKNKLVILEERYGLAKRAVIESVNDILMTVFDIDHTRHRSPVNAIVHAAAALVAYSFYPDKPSVKLPRRKSA